MNLRQQLLSSLAACAHDENDAKQIVELALDQAEAELEILAEVSSSSPAYVPLVAVARRLKALGNLIESDMDIRWTEVDHG